jgi:hypothetical protein
VTGDRAALARTSRPAIDRDTSPTRSRVGLPLMERAPAWPSKRAWAPRVALPLMQRRPALQRLAPLSGTL